MIPDIDIVARDRAEFFAILLDPQRAFGLMTVHGEVVALLMPVAAIAAVVASVIRHLSRSPHSFLLQTIGRLSLAMGIVGAGYGALRMHLDVESQGASDLFYLTPGLVQVIYTLVPGVIIFLITVVGNVGTVRPKGRYRFI